MPKGYYKREEECIKNNPRDIRKWLKSRGDRNTDDLIADENGRLFVKMRDGEGSERDVYLPIK